MTDTASKPPMLLEPIRVGQWPSDQDIVIIADDGLQTFRIHRVFLCNASEVFRDMFALPQPPDCDTLDGCPVVHLHDPAGDLRILLETLCDGLGVFKEHGLTFYAKLTILRLSAKYHMESLQSGIIRILQNDWPSRFDEYTRYIRTSSSPQYRVAQATMLIGSASESPELLRVAFYELALAPVHELYQPEVDALRAMSPMNIWRLFHGRERHHHRYRGLWDATRPQEWDFHTSDFHFELTAIEERRCASMNGIQTFRSSCLHSFIQTLGKEILNGATPILLLRRYKGTAELIAAGLCSSCAIHVLPFILNKQKEMWDSILDDFDLSTSL